MELFEGFIVGIFNYCDRWCETCALTSRCRLFADLTRYEAACDPAMNAIVDASPILPETRAPAPRWMLDLIDRVNDEAEPLMPASSARPSMAPQHREIYDRAGAYSEWVRRWLREQGYVGGSSSRAQDPLSVISWFASLNSSKIYRALTGLAEFDGDCEFPPDHEGSAKVALLGLERSQAAWAQLSAQKSVAGPLATHCIGELEWMKNKLECVIPRARAFVRPGFDEPEALARLARAEGQDERHRAS